MAKKMIIIPARLASTRFKNKILADINGTPMFIKTAQNALKSGDGVLIACDDESVAKIAAKYGFKVVLTSLDHQSGTDRINEAAQKIGLKDDEVIINLQADEPFFEVENLVNFRNFANSVLKKSPSDSGDAECYFMASAYRVANINEAKSADLVKVVLANTTPRSALYFSRSLIPFLRGEACEIYAHIGLYAYTAVTLKEFINLPYSTLENSEKLEQLRALQAGKKIAMIEVNSRSIGIDTAEDLDRALNIFKA